MIWNRIRSKLEGRDYLRNVLTLVSGSGLAQAIPVAVAPILTRLYTPEDFALLALFLAVSGLFSVAATARYEMAVLLPKDDEEAAGLVLLALTIAVVVSLVTLVPVLFWREEIAAFLGNSRIGPLLFLVPLAIVSTGAFRTLSCWANRKVQYRRIALMRVTQATTISSISIVAGLKFASGGLLVFSQIIGQMLAACLIGFKTWEERPDLKSLTKKSMAASARRYRDFPLVNTPHALMDTLQSSGIVFVVSAFFGNAVLGFYALTLRILQAPLGLVSAAFGQVFYQQAAKTHSEGGSFFPLLLKTTRRLALLCAPLLALLMVLGPELFAFAFGSEWREAGQYARILAPWIALRFIVTPVGQTPIILGRQKTAFIFGAAGNLMMLAAVACGGILGSIELGLTLLSVAMVVHLGIYLLWLIKISREAASGAEVPI